MTKPNKIRIAFFGTPEFAVTVLNALESKGVVPDLVITNPDRPKGRKLLVTAPPTKHWAAERGIAVMQPESLRGEAGTAFLEKMRHDRWDVFIVAAYGSLIPKEVLELPLHRTINVHPSLLPRFRGASPIQSAILADEKHTGVSIMIIDEQMDHGPIIGQKEFLVKEWPSATELETILGKLGGELLGELLPSWVERNIEAKEQDHHKATFTKKITKEDGLIDLADDPYLNFRKIQAFSGWPGTYFIHPSSMAEQPIRVIIKKASYSNGKLSIESVVPEGKKEMTYADLLKTCRKNL